MLDLLQPVLGADARPGEPHGLWVSAIAPDEAERATLAREHGVPGEFIDHALDPDERPRTEASGPATLVVLQIPVECRAGEPVPFVTIPLGVVVTPSSVVTICREENPVIEGLRRYASGDWPRGQRHMIALHAMKLTAALFLAHLRKIERSTDEIEARLTSSLQNREVLELLRYQKSLVYFSTALRSDALLLERLQRVPTFHIPEADHEQLEDVLIELRQAVEMSTISSEILAGMMDAFASIISNNLNVVMKAMTALTVVLLFPSLLAGVYGMNVDLPGQRSPHAFVAVVLASLSIAGLIALLFRRRGWLLRAGRQPGSLMP